MITLGDNGFRWWQSDKLQLITAILQVPFVFLCSKRRGNFCHFLLWKIKVLWLIMAVIKDLETFPMLSFSHKLVFVLSEAAVVQGLG